MPIITKRGDDGQTDLLFQKKAAKTSPRIEALGAVDELNAHLGLARVHAHQEALTTWIDHTQAQLVNLMGMLATAPDDWEQYLQKGYGTITTAEITTLETLAADHEADGNRFRGWLRPGADHSHLTAQLHVCRTVCRRAERRCWATDLATPEPRIYLNRLADVLWLLASASSNQ